LFLAYEQGGEDDNGETKKDVRLRERLAPSSPGKPSHRGMKEAEPRRGPVIDDHR
jgi:hypothetical protein